MKKKKRKVNVDANDFDMMNIELLKRYLSGEGKHARIVSRYMTGLPAKYQRQLTRAIKRARALNLL